MRAFRASAFALLLSATVLSAEDAGTEPRLPVIRETSPSPAPRPLAPRSSPQNAAVLESHALDLAYPYGILYDSDARVFWVSDVAANGGYSGDGQDHQFSAGWTATGVAIDVRNPGFTPMDGTYDPTTRMLWQISGLNQVGCAFEMNPAIGILTGRIICPVVPGQDGGEVPAFAAPQSALAYDPATDTFYSGSLDDGVIYHFDPSGRVLDSFDVLPYVSALVFNAATGHLFVLHRFIEPDVLIVDPSQGYSPVGAFNIEGAGIWSSGMRGMEMDCDGNLWIVSQPADVPFVLKVASGERGSCNVR